MDNAIVNWNISAKYETALSYIIHSGNLADQ